jgi:hypothetical protein
MIGLALLSLAVGFSGAMLPGPMLAVAFLTESLHRGLILLCGAGIGCLAILSVWRATKKG